MDASQLESCHGFYSLGLVVERGGWVVRKAVGDSVDLLLWVCLLIPGLGHDKRHSYEGMMI